MNLQTFHKVPPYPIDRPKPTGSRRPRRAGRLFMAAVPILFLVGSATWLAVPGRHAQRHDLLTHAVHYEKLQLTFPEHGVLAAAVNSDIVCRVKSRTHGSTVATTTQGGNPNVVVVVPGSPSDVVVPTGTDPWVWNWTWTTGQAPASPDSTPTSSPNWNWNWTGPADTTQTDTTQRHRDRLPKWSLLHRPRVRRGPAGVRASSPVC